MFHLDFLSGPFVEKAFAANKAIWGVYCSAFGSACGEGRGMLEDLAGNIAQMFFMLIGGGAVVAVIVAGIKIVFSAGNEGKLEEGKKIIITASIGIALAMATWGMVDLVKRLIE